MSNGLWAIGSQFKIEDAANPGVYLDFPEVINISFSRGTRENIDMTNHDSTKPFEEFIKGIAQGAQIDITFNVVPGDTTQEMLEDYWLEDTPFKARVVYNDIGATTYTFDGYLGSYSTTHNTRDAHRGSATINCTGAWVRS